MSKPWPPSPDDLLEDLQRVASEVFGPSAVARKVLKLNDTDFDVIVEATDGQHPARARLDLRSRKWEMTPKS